VVVRNGGYVCGANGGNGRNGNGHANGNSSTERKGELESHTIFQPISNESTQSSSRSVEKELPQTSRFSWEGANHARGLHDITKPSTSRGEHRPLMTGAGVLESHDSSSLRETSSSEIPRGNTDGTQPQPQQHPSSQFGHNNVRSGMGIGVNGGGGGGGGGGSAIIAPSAGNTTAARASNGNYGPGTGVNANGNTVGSSTTHGMNTTSFEGVEAVPTTARHTFEQQLLPNQALRYVNPQKATPPPKISTPTMPCHGHPGSMNHHLHHHHLNGVQAAAGVMEGINGGNSLMNTTTTRQSSCSQQDYYNAPCTAVAQGPPLSYTQGPPPYFSVNPPKFPMNNQAQQESADSRWSNGNGALSVPTSYTQKNPFNNRARSNEVPHGNRITFDPERNGAAAAAASVASAAAAPHHGAGVNGKGIVSGRIVFDPDILSQTFPQTPKGSSVDTDPLDAMQRMKTKMGVEDPLNCTATPSRNATVPSPTQPGPLAEEGQHHPQQNHTNEEEAHQRKLLNDRKQQQQQQQQAALKKARREIERKTFYVDTITSNEAMNRITNMQHLPGHINYGPNMNGLLQNMTSCSSPQDGGHGATASATANGGGRNTPGGNRHAPTRGNHHAPASVSGNSHARHGGAGSSPTTQGQQHQHQHPPQTRQQTARYAQQQQGPQRRRSHSANNINSSSRNGTNEGNDDSPLLFIHRRIEQRLPSGFVDGDGGDAYDDIHGLEEVLSCSQISTSSNGSEIKKRLRHALIGSAGTGAGGHGGGPKNTGKKNAGGGPPSNNTQAVNGGHGNGNGAHPRNGGGGHGNGNAHNGGDGMTPPPGLNEQQQQQQQQQQGTTVSNTPWPLFPSLGAPLNTTLFSPHIPPAPRFMSPHTTTIPPPRFSPSVHRPLF